MEQQQAAHTDCGHPTETAARRPRRRKPDKWANLLKSKTQEHNQLVRTVAQLEDEQRSLRVKESLLLHVLDVLSALVADASDMRLAMPAASGTASSSGGSSPSAHNDGLMRVLVKEAVRQYEQEINRVYGQTLSALYPMQHKQQQPHGITLLKALCSPDNIPKVSTLSEQQLVARLALLAGRCALHLVQKSGQPHPSDPATAELSGPPHDAYVEFSSLALSAMLWDQPKFRAIVTTNLDTLQPFEEPLPAQHWVEALHKLQLTEEQLQVLACLHDRHFWEGLKKVKEGLDRNVQQHEAHDAPLEELLRQQEARAAATLDGMQSCTAHPAAAFTACNTGAGAYTAAGGVHADALRDPAAARFGQRLEAQAALVEEQQKLMRHWTLLGLHVGIVTACTLSTYQQALFVAACYPSVPRMDVALTAYREWLHRQKLQREQQQQQQEEQRRRQRRRRGAELASGSSGQNE